MMGWALKFSSETPLKKLNWSSTTGFSLKTLCIWPAQNPEKSRDFIFKNPGIFINLKSRDPGIPGIPLRPGDDVIHEQPLMSMRRTKSLGRHCGTQNDRVHLFSNLNIGF